MGKNDGKIVRATLILSSASDKTLADSTKGDFTEFVLHFGLALAKAIYVKTRAGFSSLLATNRQQYSIAPMTEPRNPA